MTGGGPQSSAHHVPGASVGEPPACLAPHARQFHLSAHNSGVLLLLLFFTVSHIDGFSGSGQAFFLPEVLSRSITYYSVG